MSKNEPTPVKRKTFGQFNSKVVGFSGGAKAMAESSTDRALAEARIIPIDWVKPNSGQVRRSFNQEALEELAADIKERGILQPLVVRQVVGDSYEIIAGERRYRAAQIAELAELPVIIKTMTDREARLANLAENLQRQDLEPVDEKAFFEVLQNEYNLSLADIARIINKSVGYVRNRLSGNLEVLKYVDPILENTDSEIIHTHAYEAQSLNNSQLLGTVEKPTERPQRIVRTDRSIKKATRAIVLAVKTAKRETLDENTREAIQTELEALLSAIEELRKELEIDN